MSKSPRVLLLDHFDSFTYNLVQLLAAAGASVRVVRTNEMMPERGFTHLVLSPGPGHPDDVMSFKAALDRWADVVPILGVCLGCQAIGSWAGVAVVPAGRLMHGKTSGVLVTATDDALFLGVPSSFTAMRYHSLVLDSEAAAQSKALTVTARSDDGEVMAVTLTGARNVYGVQFHPESYFSETGEQLVRNFLKTQ